MKGLILASASAIALGLGGAGVAHAQGYPGSMTGPNAQTYYPNYSSYSSYTNYPRYTPDNTAGIGNTSGAFAFLTHAQVRQAQQELARAGDYTGPVNGTLDPATSEGLADWQGQHNLPPTGGFNPQTMASLGLSTAPPYYYVPSTYAYGYGAPYASQAQNYGYGYGAPYASQAQNYGYGYGAPYAYQGSSYPEAMAPSAAGGITSPSSQAQPSSYTGNAYQGAAGSSEMAPPPSPQAYAAPPSLDFHGTELA
jgi:peptidoglycan hydrolase-like protein with peptidoglycan-binding domain